MFYITGCDLSENGFVGIYKKVIAQMNVFEKEFGTAYYTFWDLKFVYLMYGKQMVKKKRAITRKDFTDVIVHWIQEYDVQQTYIRYIFAHRQLIRLLQYLKEKNIKTIIEIPTYPYDGEIPYNRFKIEDVFYREKISDYIERITTYSNHKEIWGIPCIPLRNGIDIEEKSIVPYKEKKKDIVMIAVASMSQWHGYERIIEGLYYYYKAGGEWNLRLKLIGEGLELNRYKQLVEGYGLQARVDFYGRLEGQALSDVFEQSDIGMVSFGLYKTGIDEASPIKGAEYCARGIPIVCGYNDLRFPEDTFFVLRVPNCELPLNMEQIIDFYESVVEQKDFKEKIYHYAMQYLSWDGIMKPIIEYFSNVNDKRN